MDQLVHSLVALYWIWAVYFWHVVEQCLVCAGLKVTVSDGDVVLNKCMYCRSAYSD